MMNIKFTKRDILNNFKNIICVGYCDIQYLLRYTDRMGYTCGVYGWNADIYKIDNTTVIVTGYRPFGNIPTNYNINKKYDDEARLIANNWNISFESKQEKVNKLLEKYVKEILKSEV